MISLVSVRDRPSWRGRGGGSAREAEMKLPRMESGGAQLKGNLKSRKKLFLVAEHKVFIRMEKGSMEVVWSMNQGTGETSLGHLRTRLR